MKKLIAVVAVLFSVSAAAQRSVVECGETYAVQWVHSKNVPGISAVSLDGINPFTWTSMTFPYTIPTGYLLLVKSMSLGSKFTNNERASMLVFNNVGTVPASIGTITYDPPVVVPYWAGVSLTASIINNTNEAQWTTSQISGYLVQMTPGMTIYNAYRCAK